jgi:hypothetical protein
MDELILLSPVRHILRANKMARAFAAGRTASRCGVFPSLVRFFNRQPEPIQLRVGGRQLC